MGPLRSVRISRMALALVAMVSGLATVVIVHTGLRRTPAQTAALVALAERRQLAATAKSAPPTPAPTTAATPTSGPSDASGGQGGGGSGDASSSDTSTGTSTNDAGGSGSGGSGDGSSGNGNSGSGGSGDGTSTNTTTTPRPDAGLPSVGHVFLISLSTPSYADAFGARAKTRYLRSLVGRGALLTHFESLGHGELADELAMVSGQAPNRDTSAGCTTFREYPARASANAKGLVSGKGCVYPDSALTLGDQVTSDGKVWGAYIAAMGKTTCQHPNSNASTGLALPGTDPGYDVTHNPFVFFHSLLDAGDCFNDDHDLTKLPRALQAPSRTPRFTYIAPDACADGKPALLSPADTAQTPTTGTTTTPTTTTTTTAPTTTTGTTTTTTSATTTSATVTSTTPSSSTSNATAPAGCPAGQATGLTAEDAFLKEWVPAITHSAAYRHNGVLVIAFAGTRATVHPIRTGALVLSRYASRGTRLSPTYRPYSLLRSLEDMLNDTPLAHAATATSFAKAVLAPHQ